MKLEIHCLKKIKLNWLQICLKKQKQTSVNFYMPEDVVVADAFSNDANTKAVSIENIPDGWQALDIGPKTGDYLP